MNSSRHGISALTGDVGEPEFSLCLNRESGRTEIVPPGWVFRLFPDTQEFIAAVTSSRHWNHEDGPGLIRGQPEGGVETNRPTRGGGLGAQVSRPAFQFSCEAANQWRSNCATAINPGTAAITTEETQASQAPTLSRASCVHT